MFSLETLSWLPLLSLCDATIYCCLDRKLILKSLRCISSSFSSSASISSSVKRLVTPGALGPAEFVAAALLSIVLRPRRSSIVVLNVSGLSLGSTSICLAGKTAPSAPLMGKFCLPLARHPAAVFLLSYMVSLDEKFMGVECDRYSFNEI